MQIVRRYRIPAISCALAVLLCELIAWPYANMGICDDWSYIVSVQKLVTTGHIVYVGWSAAMLGWQLYLGATFVKLFGFSFSTVRMSTLFVAMLLAFLLQRILVRSGITERNATIGTLALVLSPLYLELSVTFMSDIHGLFAIVLCIYACLRALQSATNRAAILWLCFAVATNALIGTSRQLAWLGVLVMVPSTLWLLRARRRVLFAGAAITLLGALFILACMHWLKLQPYTLPEHFGISAFPVSYTLHQFLFFFLDLPFLLLPIVALFFPQTRKSGLRIVALIILTGCIFLAVYPSRFQANSGSILEPTFYDWVTAFGGFNGSVLKGNFPLFLNRGVRGLFTLASLGGLLGLIASFVNSPQAQPTSKTQPQLSWISLGILLVPFTLAYILLLVYRAITIADAGTPEILDRYWLGLLVVAVLVLVRYYQDRIDFRLPFAAFLLIAIMAAYGVVVTHNTFAFYRARVAIAEELRAADVPDNFVDYGWEYNMPVELERSSHINDPLIVVPAHAYIPTPDAPADQCHAVSSGLTPHLHPIYGISFDPTTCYGSAPFAPVQYSRWLASGPGTLYVVRYTISTP